MPPGRRPPRHAPSPRRGSAVHCLRLRPLANPPTVPTQGPSWSKPRARFRARAQTLISSPMFASERPVSSDMAPRSIAAQRAAQPHSRPAAQPPSRCPRAPAGGRQPPSRSTDRNRPSCPQPAITQPLAIPRAQRQKTTTIIQSDDGKCDNNKTNANTNNNNAANNNKRQHQHQEPRQHANANGTPLPHQHGGTANNANNVSA